MPGEALRGRNVLGRVERPSQGGRDMHSGEISGGTARALCPPPPHLLVPFVIDSSLLKFSSLAHRILLFGDTLPASSSPSQAPSLHLPLRLAVGAPSLGCLSSDLLLPVLRVRLWLTLEPLSSPMTPRSLRCHRYKMELLSWP